jgi:hypothetical protein
MRPSRRRKIHGCLLSTYMTNTLQAFTALLFANGSALLKETYEIEANTSAENSSTAPPKVAKRRWTDNSRGTGTMNEWPPEIHTLCKIG